MGSLNKIIIAITLASTLTITKAQELSGVAVMVNAGLTSTKGFPTTPENLYTDSTRFSKGYTLIGAEGYYRNRRAIVSLSGYLGIQRAQPYRDGLLERSLWTASAGLGWIIYGDSKFSFYPSVALGITGLSLTEHKHHHPYTQISLVQEIVPSADFSLHLDYMMTHSDPEDRVVDGIVLGIKTGYNYGASSTTPFRGWYATISFGGLAFMKRKQ